MNNYAIFAIFILFWWTSLFLVLPFRLRTSDEPEEHVPGQVESAPPRFSVRRTLLWTTIIATILFALFYANYVHGWITTEMFDLTWWMGRRN
jgi:predicted secreted protein